MVRYAVREVVRRKGRSAWTAAGYALAVAFFVVSTALGESHSRRTQRRLSVPGTKFVVFRPARDQGAFAEGGPFAEGVYTERLTEEDVRRVAGIPGVTSAAPYLLYRRDHPGWRRLVSIGGLDMDRVGTWEDFCAPRDLVEGRFLRPDDIHEVVLEESFARAANLRVGDLLSAFGRDFRVAGIVNANIRPVKPDLYAPLPVVRRIVGGAGGLNVILVSVADPLVQDRVLEAVRDFLPEAVVVTYNCYRPARTGILMTLDLVGIISLAVLGAAVLFAAKSQMASVAERTGDIGVLKAMGWSGGDLLRQILAESCLLAAAGAAAGGLGGLLAVLGIRLVGGPWEGFGGAAGAAALGVGLTLLGGVIAGGVPAAAAYRMRPAEALRRG